MEIVTGPRMKGSPSVSTEIIIPWRSDCPHRARALRWVQARYAHEHPDWQVTVATAPDGPWSKGSAVNPAVERSTADVVIVADADVWTDGLPAAVAAVEAGAPWCIPHHTVHRLDEHATAAVLDGQPWQDQPLDERAYRGIQGGGFVIATREVILSTPLDARFVGWGRPGQEDECWAIALHTLHGPAWRGTAPLVHLWHPPQDRWTRRRGSRESWHLRQRYSHASANPAHMRALIEEARHAAQHAPEPRVHSPAA